MLYTVKPPNSLDKLPQGMKVALFGSIEMGRAVDWQEQLTVMLSSVGSNTVLLNPRCEQWNSDWAQSIKNPDFKNQVNWELTAGEIADLVIVFFQPDTKAPISFGELCMAAVRKPQDTIVCCPEGYWRKGNVDVVCERYKIEQVVSLQQMADAILHREQSWIRRRMAV